MKQYRAVRKIATIPVVANGFQTIDLPRDYDYETVFLRVNGTVTVGAGGATSVRAEAPCQVIQRAEIVVDGKNNIYSAPGWHSVLANHSRRTLDYGARATTPPTAAAAATYTVEALGAVDLMTVDSVRPKDTNFRSSGLSLFQLRLTFGAAGDMFVPGAGAVTFTAMYVDIFVAQMVEVPDAAGNMTTPIALRKVSFQEIALPSSNANQELRLPAGNYIRSVVIRTEGDTTAGEPGIACLNAASLEAGLDTRILLSGAQIRAKNNMDYGRTQSGYYYIDVTTKGNAPVHLSELWDVTGAAEPKLKMDVTGGANMKMQAVVTEYIFAAGSAA